MSALMLFAAWGTALLARFAFIAFQVNQIESLWYDFEHRGFRFQLARLLDALSLVGYVAFAYWILSGMDLQQCTVAQQIGIVFVAWFGLLLLFKFPAHRFPRTNVPGAMDDAKAELVVRLIVSFIHATAIAVGFAIWIRFQK